MPPNSPSQCPGHILPHGHSQNCDQDYAFQPLHPNTMISAKRQLGEDDDIQFISEKPVKRRRSNEKQFVMPMADAPPSTPGIAMQLLESEEKNTERRLSTGMVSLTPDVNAMELAYALRGVSMPVLENFVLDQPSRKPRRPSPPDLSPKQLPLTVSPAMLNAYNDEGASHSKTPAVAPTLYISPIQTSSQTETPMMVSDLKTMSTSIPKNCALVASIHSQSCVRGASFIHPNHDKRPSSNTLHMPPPIPSSEVPHHMLWGSSNTTSSENHHQGSSPTYLQKQPCRICSHLRHHAQLSGPQGQPMINTGLVPPIIQSPHYHQSHGQHFYPQMITMPANGMHRFGPGFTPVMMPVNNSQTGALPAHQQPQHLPQQVVTQQKRGTEKDKPTAPEPTPRKTPSSKATICKITEPAPNTTPSPSKPPASLIKPATYRKPSPNLIVDVAETCQEKFPFEEVAKRHNVTVDKVFEIFAAIIQVSHRETVLFLKSEFSSSLSFH